jgi:hypothetical protein
LIGALITLTATIWSLKRGVRRRERKCELGNTRLGTMGPSYQRIQSFDGDVNLNDIDSSLSISHRYYQRPDLNFVTAIDTRGLSTSTKSLQLEQLSHSEDRLFALKAQYQNMN